MSHVTPQPPHYATDKDVEKTLKIMAKNSTRAPDGKFVILETPEINNLHSKANMLSSSNLVT